MFHRVCCIIPLKRIRKGSFVSSVRWWGILWCLFLSTAPLHAHSATLRSTQPASRRLGFAHIGVDEGLAQSSVYCILQDRTGFLWFGTGDGLERYDGYSLSHFRHKSSDTTSLAANTVRCLFEDRDGILWIGTDDGLSEFDRDTERFTTHPIVVHTARSSFRTGLAQISEHSPGKLLLRTTVGLHIFDVRTRTLRDFWIPLPLLTKENTLMGLDSDASGRFVVGTQSGIRVVQENGDRCTEIPLAAAVRAALKNVIAHEIRRDAEGFYWIGTEAHGVFRLDPSFTTLVRYHKHGRPPFSIPDNFVNAIAQIQNDRSSLLLIGCGEGSLMQFDPLHKRFIPYDSIGANGGDRPGVPITSFFPDRSNVLWIGTDGDGVYKVNTRPAQFHHYVSPLSSPDNENVNFLKAICEDRDGILWLGAYNGGLVRFDRRTDAWRSFRYEPRNPRSLASNNVYALHEDARGTLWVGTDSGLAAFDKRSMSFTRYLRASAGQPAMNHITAIAHGDTNTLWLSTRQGSCSFDLRRKQFVHDSIGVHTMPAANIFFGNTTHIIYKDRSNMLWSGTYGNGLLRFDPQTRTASLWAHNPNDESSLSNNIIRSIREDTAGTIWIGTEEGLNRFNAATSTFTRFTQRDGLPNDFIYGILCDAKNNLWISTNKGLSKFTIATQRFRNYGPEDGLQSNEFNTGAFFQSTSGEMFFGGINGLNTFFPDSVEDNPHLPNVVLTDFKKFDVSVRLDTAVSVVSEIHLNYDETVFSFQFAALEYTDVAKNQYAYMMEGFESDWTYCGTRREVRYTNLSPGTYRFRVKAANDDGVWNENGLSVAIIITPPFWMAWWFRGAAGLFMLGAIFGGTRFVELRRIRRHLAHLEQESAVERERSRISRDMHDELGANLTSLSMMTEVARRSLGDQSTVDDHLRKMTSIASETLQKLDEIVWAVNPQADRLDNLAAYISEYAQEIFDATNIRVRFDFPEEIPEIPLAADVRHNIFLVVKESFTNILKHSCASEVTVSIRLHDARLHVEVRDNGKGTALRMESGLGNGIRNMRQRIESVGGTLAFSSSVGNGTAVKVEVKT
ncbi:MAG: hypothetical protein HY961_00135 [Ignavibacteriae bacterium]|nr:hypothetical protein [Ignavibacteriota bacterium]